MKKYIVTWDTVEESTVGESYEPTVDGFFKKIKRIEFEDIQFKDFYIRATDDDTGETYVIPYGRIYDIVIRSDEENDEEIGGYAVHSSM
jgi:hypothetical protein